MAIRSPTYTTGKALWNKKKASKYSKSFIDNIFFLIKSRRIFKRKSPKWSKIYNYFTKSIVNILFKTRSQEKDLSLLKSENEFLKLVFLNFRQENDKSLFMQFATLEIDCKLIIWTIVELKNIDLNVFETDLGLLPGGKIKLVKSSQIPLNNLLRYFIWVWI